MALTDTEKQKAIQLKEQGYTADEIKEYIGASRAGRPSVTEQEITQRSNQGEVAVRKHRDWLDIAGAPGRFLAPQATSVFGDALARRGIGTDVSTEVTREYIEEPTLRQYAGAVLQTGVLAAEAGLTVGSFGAAAPLTVGRNVAIGGGLGYAYDVSDDLVAQEDLKDTLMPGIGTVIGAGAPLAFAAAGAVFRGLSDDAARATAPIMREAVGDGAEAAVEQGAADFAAGIGETARTVGNRFTRSKRRIDDIVQSNAERAALRQNARDAVKFALDEGLEVDTITRIEQASPASRAAYREVVEAAEGANPRQAEIVSGRYATEMYRIARNRQTDIGTRLGEARRALGNEPINNPIVNQHMRTFKASMAANRMKLNADGSISFPAASKYTDEQQAILNKIWGRMSQVEQPTPQDIDELNQFLTRLQYQSNVTDKLGNVYIDVVDTRTGTTQPVSVFNYIRNTYDSMLEQVDTSGNVAALRKDYAQVKNITDDIESSWFNGINIQKASDEDLADAASLALRRIDSRAKSRTSYKNMYQALDAYARANGYKGADAADVSNFYLSTVEPMYSKTTPEASFRGGISGGIRSVFENVFDLGKADITDKQRALRGLLDEESIPANINQSRIADTEDDIVMEALMRLDIIDADPQDAARIESLRKTAANRALNEEELLEAQQIVESVEGQLPNAG